MLLILFLSTEFAVRNRIVTFSSFSELSIISILDCDKDFLGLGSPQLITSGFTQGTDWQVLTTLTAF